jgi:hypothetical protein
MRPQPSSPVSSTCTWTALQHQQQGYSCREYHHMFPVTPDATASKGYCTLWFEILDSVLLQQLIGTHVPTSALFCACTTHINTAMYQRLELHGRGLGPSHLNIARD